MNTKSLNVVTSYHSNRDTTNSIGNAELGGVQGSPYSSTSIIKSYVGWHFVIHGGIDGYLKQST